MTGQIEPPHRKGEDPQESTNRIHSKSLPAERNILSRALSFTTEKDLRVDDFIICVNQDPVLVIELFGAAAKAPDPKFAMSVVGAAEHLAAQFHGEGKNLSESLLAHTLYPIQDRLRSESSEARRWFEIVRSRAKRTGTIARILAHILAKNLGEEIQLAGLLSYFGDFISLLVIPDDYISVAKETERVELTQTVLNQFHFDIEKVGISYLKHKSVPEPILSAIDPLSKSKDRHRAIIRPIVNAAIEIVESFDMNRWDKLAPGKPLPARSALMALRFQEKDHYSRLYERASEYLFANKMVEEKQRRLEREGKLPAPARIDPPKSEAKAVMIDVIEAEPGVDEQIRLRIPSYAPAVDDEDDLSALFSGNRSNSPLNSKTGSPKPHMPSPSGFQNFEQESKFTAAPKSSAPKIVPAAKNTNRTEFSPHKNRVQHSNEPEPAPAPRVVETNPPPVKQLVAVQQPPESIIDSVIGSAERLMPLSSQKSLEERFRLSPSKKIEKPARAAVPNSDESSAALKTKLSKAQKKLLSLLPTIDAATTGEELISSLLAILVDQGLFEKSALIVVSHDRKDAIVVAARGPNIGNGQRLVLEDPISPLSQSLSKIQSFGKLESALSPFGSKTFAIAPIDADHPTPVALYADCGNDGSISFEARRVFRSVVERVNARLKTIPGGMPVEIKT